MWQKVCESKTDEDKKNLLCRMGMQTEFVLPKQLLAFSIYILAD
jgi:hypothetical protein